MTCAHSKLPQIEPITVAPCPRPGPAQETAAAASASQPIQKGMSEKEDDITDEDIRLCQRILEHTITNSPQYRLPFTEDTEAWHAVICTLLDNDKLSQATTTKAMHLILGRARDGESSTAFPMGPILAECASFSAAAQRSTGSLFLQPASAAHFDTLETTDDGL